MGDEGAVEIGRHHTSGTTISAVATHGKGSGEVAASGGIVHRTTGTTTATDGLEEDGIGVISSGLDQEGSDL